MRVFTALFGLAFACATSACGDLKCPPGYLLEGEKCYRCRVVDGPDGSMCVRDASVSLVEAGALEDEPDTGTDSINDAGAASPMMDGGDASAGQAFDAAMNPLDGAVDMPADAAGNDAAARDDAEAPKEAGPNGCLPNPCQNGGTCVNQGNNGHTCSCPPDHPGSSCEFRVCGITTIQTRADIEAAADCGEIDGDLNIGANFGDITSADLPNLNIIRGKLKIAPLLSPTTPIDQGAQKVTLLALATVEGGVELLGNATLREFYFPSLTTIGTPARSVTFSILGSLWMLDLPQLRTVYGSIAWMTSLCSLDISNIQSVSGNFTATDWIRLPYSSVQPLIDATSGTKPANAVGCCNVVDRNNCSGFDGNRCATSACP